MLTVKTFAPILATVLLAAVLTPAAQAKGNAEAGATKAAVCTACHGVNGNSVNPEWPNLAGQNARYIEEQLRLFRAGHRNNMVMYPLAMALTDEDIADLAAYFSTQTPSGQEADAANYKTGEALYRGGDRTRGIPSCTSCHGPVGLGNPGSGFPALRAQHSTYTLKQLLDYAADQRYVDIATNTPTKSRNGHMMSSIAKRKVGITAASARRYPPTSLPGRSKFSRSSGTAAATATRSTHSSKAGRKTASPPTWSSYAYP
ncbi:MAG: cytochrome c4 [Gammaproteobacteria bacterium]|nr:cytochrome c4 [Gammaproteobacteria bacterium]